MNRRAAIVSALGSSLLLAGALVAAAHPAVAGGTVTATASNGATASIFILDDRLDGSTSCVSVPVSVHFILPSRVYTGMVTLYGQQPGSSSREIFDIFSYYNLADSTGFATKEGSFQACSPGTYNVWGEFTAGQAPTVSSPSILVQVAGPPPAPLPTPTSIPTITPAATQVCVTEGGALKCVPGMTWSSVRCWSSRRPVTVTDKTGTTVLRVRPKRSADCPKSRPFQTRISMTEAGPNPFAYTVANGKQRYSVSGVVSIV